MNDIHLPLKNVEKKIKKRVVTLGFEPGTKSSRPRRAVTKPLLVYADLWVSAEARVQASLGFLGF